MRYTPVLLILLFISACTPDSTPSPSGGTPVAIGVTQVNSNGTPNTAEAIMPVIMPSQVAIRCEGAPETRLIVQQRGRVTDDNNDTLNLRSGPGVSYEILQALNPGDEFMVTDGPSCEGGFSWFRIRYGNYEGWIAEGDNDSYYVEPYLSG